MRKTKAEGTYRSHGEVQRQTLKQNPLRKTKRREKNKRKLQERKRKSMRKTMVEGT